VIVFDFFPSISAKYQEMMVCENKRGFHEKRGERNTETGGSESGGRRVSG
jgi:hypothetical protein